MIVFFNNAWLSVRYSVTQSVTREPTYRAVWGQLKKPLLKFTIFVCFCQHCQYHHQKGRGHGQFQLCLFSNLCSKINTRPFQQEDYLSVFTRLQQYRNHGMSVGGAKVVRSGWWRVRGRRGEPAAPPERGTSPATPAAASPLSTSPSCIKRKEHLEECAEVHDQGKGKDNHGEEG